MSASTSEVHDTERRWASGEITRVPFWIYQDAGIAALERERIFQGPTWSYLCLETELKSPGDWLTTWMGDMPVVVTRDLTGAIRAFENRCVHRGALICIENSGRADKSGRLSCVYHNWTYDLAGNLKSVAFQRGVSGKGGMPASFDPSAHNPRQLRVTTLCGLVFGGLGAEAPAIEDYLGEEVLARIRRVMHKPVAIIGKVTQALPYNWKLYFENVKDSYHASLLHLFASTFGLNRMTQPGGLIVSPDGRHHVSYAYINQVLAADSEYRREELRSNSDYRLKDTRMLDVVDEFGDGITNQILTVFPGLVVQQILNTIAVRQIVPQGAQRTALNWTFLGFADDSEEMRKRRLLQTNMIGPAGYVSLEDGVIGGFVQRGIGTAQHESGIIEMGGTSTASTDTRATEAAVRGFWKAYRAVMAV